MDERYVVYNGMCEHYVENGKSVLVCHDLSLLYDFWQWVRKPPVGSTYFEKESHIINDSDDYGDKSIAQCVETYFLIYTLWHKMNEIVGSFDTSVIKN